MPYDARRAQHSNDGASVVHDLTDDDGDAEAAQWRGFTVKHERSQARRTVLSR
jgi:hypothetical protein